MPDNRRNSQTGRKVNKGKRPPEKKSVKKPVNKTVKKPVRKTKGKDFPLSKGKKAPVKKQQSFNKDRQRKNTPENQQRYDFYGKNINGEYDDRYYDEAAMKSLKKKRRGKKVSKRVIKLQKILVSCLIVLVVLVVGVTLSLTVFFKTAEYEINGKTRYDREEIIAACGIKEGENIFLADKQRSEENIINTFPYVAEAEVTFGIPDKIVITIKEGKPCYMVKYAKKQFCVVSREGRILKISEKKVSGLPIVKGVKLKSNTPGSYVEYNNEKNSKTLATLVTSLNSCGFENLSEINVSNKAKITFTYDKRILVQLGLPEDIDYKVRTAKAIITDKLDPNNTGLISGTLDVRSCKETKRSYFNEKSIVPEAEKASTTVPATDAYGNPVDNSNNGTDNGTYYGTDYGADYGTDYGTDYGAAE